MASANWVSPTHTLLYVTPLTSGLPLAYPTLTSTKPFPVNCFLKTFSTPQKHPAAKVINLEVEVVFKLGDKLELISDKCVIIF